MGANIFAGGIHEIIHRDNAHSVTSITQYVRDNNQ